MPAATPPGVTPGTTSMRDLNAGMQRMHNLFAMSIGIPILAAGIFVVAIGGDAGLGIALILLGSALVLVWRLVVKRRSKQVVP